MSPGDPIGVAAGIGMFEFAQTFTAGITGTLSSVHLWIRRYREDVDLVVEVLPMVAGRPAADPAPPLASIVLPALSAPPFALSDELTPVDLTRFRIPVERGEVLAVSLRTGVEPPFGLGFSWDGRQAAYAGGTSFSRARGESAWLPTSRPELDLGLKTFVEPRMACPDRPTLIAQDSPVPEPGHHTEELFAHAVTTVTVTARPGRAGSTRLHGAFVSDFPEGLELQGWSILAATLGDVAIVEVTTDGTASAPLPEGYSRGGFNETGLIPNPRSTTCAASAASSTVMLALTLPAALPPRGTATVLSMLVEALSPQGPDPITGTLEWPLDCCRWYCTNVACGQPCGVSVTVSGETGGYCEQRGAEVRFVADRTISFRRGDSNGDGRVDISDAIRTVMFLFLGAAEPPCLDAADATDDGAIDLSDGIAILNDFFRPGTGISAPGPFSCGADPSADRLLCADYVLCE